MHSIHDTHITYFARTNARNSNQLFGIKQLDWLYHTYIIGKTGAGKTTLLETCIIQDVYNNEGLTLIDPHGDLAEHLVARIPKHRKDDLIYFNVGFGSNPDIESW